MEKQIELYEKFPLDGNITDEFLTNLSESKESLLEKGLLEKDFNGYYLGNLDGLLEYIKGRDRQVRGKDFSPNLLACLIHCRRRDKYANILELEIQTMISALRRNQFTIARRAFNNWYNNKCEPDIYILLSKIMFDLISKGKTSLNLSIFENIGVSETEKNLISLIINEDYENAQGLLSKIISSPEATEMQFILLLLLKYKNKQHFLGILPVHDQLISNLYIPQKKKDEEQITESWSLSDFKNRLLAVRKLVQPTTCFIHKDKILLLIRYGLLLIDGNETDAEVCKNQINIGFGVSDYHDIIKGLPNKHNANPVEQIIKLLLRFIECIEQAVKQKREIVEYKCLVTKYSRYISTVPLGKEELFGYYNNILNLVRELISKGIDLSCENELVYACLLGIALINGSQLPDFSDFKNGIVPLLKNNMFFTAIKRVHEVSSDISAIWLKNVLESIIYLKYTLLPQPITLEDIATLIADKQSNMDVICQSILNYLNENENGNPFVVGLAKACLCYHLYEETDHNELGWDLFAIKYGEYRNLKTKYSSIFSEADPDENNVVFGITRIILHSICTINNEDYSDIGTAKMRMRKLDLTRSNRGFLQSLITIMQRSRQAGIPPKVMILTKSRTVPVMKV